jgi:heme oxygenase
MRETGLFLRSHTKDAHDALHFLVPTANGHAAFRVPVVAPLSPTLSAADLLGFCHVAKGATLGGKLIARHPRSTLKLARQFGILFFDSEVDSSLSWTARAHALDSRMCSVENQRAALHGAARTFEFPGLAFTAAERTEVSTVRAA